MPVCRRSGRPTMFEHPSWRGLSELIWVLEDHLHLAPHRAVLGPARVHRGPPCRRRRNRMLALVGIDHRAGWSRPSVVLPQPLSPTSPTVSPRIIQADHRIDRLDRPGPGSFWLPSMRAKRTAGCRIACETFRKALDLDEGADSEFSFAARRSGDGSTPSNAAAGSGLNQQRVPPRQLERWQRQRGWNRHSPGGIASDPDGVTPSIWARRSLVSWSSLGHRLASKPLV